MRIYEYTKFHCNLELSHGLRSSAACSTVDSGFYCIVIKETVHVGVRMDRLDRALPIYFLTGPIVPWSSDIKEE